MEALATAGRLRTTSWDALRSLGLALGDCLTHKDNMEKASRLLKAMMASIIEGTRKWEKEGNLEDENVLTIITWELVPEMSDGSVYSRTRVTREDAEWLGCKPTDLNLAHSSMGAPDWACVRGGPPGAEDEDEDPMAMD